MYQYAQIDSNGVCIGVSQLSSEIQSDSYIPIQGDQLYYLRRIYRNNIWTDEVIPLSQDIPEEIQPVLDTRTPLYLHITLTDGDGIDPIGMLNDGVDAISISAAFRQTADPASAVLTMITGMWRVVIRDSDNLVYDIIGVEFINGVASFPYTSTNRPAICKLHESDLNALPIIIGETEYKIVLVNPVEFKVYRTLQ